MKLLVVIDMQNDFVTGVLGTKEACQIVDGIASFVNDYDGTVVYTKDTHGEDYLHTMEGEHLPVAHCIKGTAGWQVVDKIDQALKNAKAKEFLKPTFGSKELMDYVTELNTEETLEQVDLVGVCTDICVISNAMLIKAAIPEVKLCVHEDLTAGVTPESHENALNAMRMCHIEIV